MSKAAIPSVSLPDPSPQAGEHPRRVPWPAPRRRGTITLRTWLIGAAIASQLCVVAALCHGHGYRTRLVRWITGARAPAPRHVEIVLGSVAEGAPDPAIRFQKVMLPAAAGAGFTCVQVGPDHRLYAGADDGRIFRFPILPDGTVGAPRIITSLQQAEGGNRLLTGFCFDPAAPADEPVLWVAHGYYAFHGAPDFSGRISRISGKDLDRVEDAVINLPRSFKDHLTNQPSFGPDGALYIPQGSNSAYGAPDPVWGNRPERLLNASILRLDIHKLTSGHPLDVRTPDGGGSYDPFAPGAPLTIYAGGIRNAYDLCWADNGRLYVPVNGSSSGGNTPAGPGAPALVDVPIAENDWLFCIIPGKYYGHPNPRQHHFVLNGGNPGNSHTTSVIPTYPPGTMPDPDWQPPEFDFGPHVSADGIIEYHGGAFGGKLDRNLIVCRFNVGADLICLHLAADGRIDRVQTHVPGLSHLHGPLDLAEDPTNGNLYVSEYAAHRITLMRPVESGVAVDDAEESTEPSSLSAAAEAGRERFSRTCIACHGPTGQGIPHLGADLTHSRFIASQSDDALAAFIARGRQTGDPNSVLGLIMPPKGGDPSLDDASIRQLVAFLRTLNVAPAQAVARIQPAPDRR